MRTRDTETSRVVDELRPKTDRARTEESAQSEPDQREPVGAEYAAAAMRQASLLSAHSLVKLQRAVGNAGMGSALGRSPVLDVVGSGGRPLDEDVRTEMEGRLGADFSGVRVHTDSTAADSAKAVNAQAYTVGRDVVFGAGKFDPGSDSGKHMLAHELTHVVQQASGPVEGTSTGDGVAVSDPSDRFEREASANADRVMSQPAPAAAHADVQRFGDEPEQLQRCGLPEAEGAVQREEEEEAESSEAPHAEVQREAEEDEAAG